MRDQGLEPKSLDVGENVRALYVIDFGDGTSGFLEVAADFLAAQVSEPSPTWLAAIIMSNEPLIFTPELMADANARSEATRPLIQRWAVFAGQGRELARGQLEDAARLVPPEKRRRALGPLYSDNDKQVFAAAGVLLLAKTLTDQGWQVEHEPEIEGVTPDCRITKNAAEVRSSRRDTSPGTSGCLPATSGSRRRSGAS